MKESYAKKEKGQEKGNSKGKIYLLSLGCVKNLVDSEMMWGLLEKDHWQMTDDPQEAAIIIVNTCGFIQDAKEEAIEYILQLAEYKKIGCCCLLVVVGCMAEKYQKEMAAAMPEIDAFLGTSQYQQIAGLIDQKMGMEENFSQYQDGELNNPYLLRHRGTDFYTAYLKIAEGCNNCCTYCLIPQLRGPLQSRYEEDILAEAEKLANEDVKELIIIAQDITAYGMDIYGRPCLPQLLQKLADLPFQWIRLLYAYPNYLDRELLQVMAANKNICHYLDLPLQHIDDHVLEAMNRKGDSALIREKLRLIKEYLPDIALRTTVMVGFPGETKQAFTNLLDFLQEGHFQWAGAFAYSREKDTLAYNMKGQKDQATKERRLAKVMALLAEISYNNMERYLGKTLEILVEAEVDDLQLILPPGQRWYQGRSRYQAPDIDGLVYFSANDLKIGDMVEVLITKADIYDLIGEMAN